MRQLEKENLQKIENDLNRPNFSATVDSNDNIYIDMQTGINLEVLR